MIFFHVNRYSVLNEEKENILDQYDPRSVDDRNTMDVAMFTKKLVQVHMYLYVFRVNYLYILYGNTYICIAIKTNYI